MRDTLAVLDLPEELWPQVADGTIPLSVVKALVRLGKIHEGLPAVAVKRVLDGPLQQWDEPLSWDDVIADPIRSRSSSAAATVSSTLRVSIWIAVATPAIPWLDIVASPTSSGGPRRVAPAEARRFVARGVTPERSAT